MSEQLVERFIAALKDIEQNENSDQMAELFDDTSEIGNVLLPEKFKGQDGAREFWKSYRESFGYVSSTFQNKLVSENTIALEWTSTFKRLEGAESVYQGVSMIETDGDKIKRFFAYFNPHDLEEKPVETANGQGA